MATKYHNNKCIWKGETFDSQHELERYILLKCDEKDGKIRNLQRQVKFELVPAMRVDGHSIRATYYIADFTYDELRGDEWHKVIEDAKGCRTRDYIIKAKLMAYKYGVFIKET